VEGRLDVLGALPVSLWRVPDWDGVCAAHQVAGPFLHCSACGNEDPGRRQTHEASLECGSLVQAAVSRGAFAGATCLLAALIAPEW
jgi:hypothetical protein